VLPGGETFVGEDAPERAAAAAAGTVHRDDGARPARRMVE
jgi:hypothetical protein